MAGGGGLALLPSSNVKGDPIARNVGDAIESEEKTEDDQKESGSKSARTSKPRESLKARTGLKEKPVEEGSSAKNTLRRRESEDDRGQRTDAITVAPPER